MKNQVSPIFYPFQIKGQGMRAGRRLQRGPRGTQQRGAAESTGYPTSRRQPGSPPPILTAYTTDISGPQKTVRSNVTSYFTWEEEHNSGTAQEGDVSSTSVLFSCSPSMFLPSFSQHALFPLLPCPHPCLPSFGPSMGTDYHYLVRNKPIFNRTCCQSQTLPCFSFIPWQTPPFPHLVLLPSPLEICPTEDLSKVTSNLSVANPVACIQSPPGGPSNLPLTSC